MLKIICQSDMPQKVARENEALKAENNALKAKIDYLSMMTGVELDEREEKENGNEI